MQRSHALLLAYDRSDVGVVDEALASQFVHFEGEDVVDRDGELAAMSDTDSSPGEVPKHAV